MIGAHVKIYIVVFKSIKFSQKEYLCRNLAIYITYKYCKFINKKLVFIDIERKVRKVLENSGFKLL